MTVRVEVQPSVLAWASQRSGRDSEYLHDRFRRLSDWERGEGDPPTLRQLEDFATATHTPIGMLLLPEPPVESLPLPDFRTFADRQVEAPSADLLDTIYLAQQRQEWYRTHARANGFEPIGFVGSMDRSTAVQTAATRMREELSFDVDARTGTWTGALRVLTEHAEDAGILVMVSGVVGSDTHRRLDPDEFRGFSLVDDLAPVVFVNGSDTKAAQNFTLVHELAHIWLGLGGVDNPGMASRQDSGVERWCNAVAAEVLVPEDTLLDEFDGNRDLVEELDRLARRFKVSTLVVLHSLYDANVLGWEDFRSAYEAEVSRVSDLARDTGRGNFYNTAPVRASKRFTHAIITDVLEGGTPERDASRLLGFRWKAATFANLAEHVGAA